ncbi:MAG: 5'-nucleotidase, lipoprotein e(P4) family [Candidatus Eisenbacteria bacterium]|nr:5'-nucleotidase, lipoprotein e(P4) family [Candidatus Eisenbacteria bacterium]MCC7143691.1 5'-nucleotidase, lipoprotein e(P4) family [Candidatus Eisenbacteria bacterium]
MQTISRAVRPVITAALLGAALLSAGCGSSARLTHENLNGLLWMQTSGEYRAACLTAYRTATTQMEKALADPGWTAALEQSGDLSALAPAVILDADETALDNSAYQSRLAKSSRGFAPDTWSAWCREELATAVPGASDFCRAAVERGVTLLFVTNRDTQLAESTLRNLGKAGFPNDPRRVQVIGKTAESDKGPRRADLSRRYRILLLVGDQLGDFVSVPNGASSTDRAALAEQNAAMWGTRWIALPNCTYGDWERSLVDSKRSDEENLKAKFGRLRD